MIKRIRRFLKADPDLSNGDVIAGILMLGYAALFIVVTVVSLARDLLKG